MLEQRSGYASDCIEASVVDAVSLRSTNMTINIAAGEDLTMKYTDASGVILAQVEATGFLDQTADEHRIVYPLADAAKEQVGNSAIVLHMLTGEIITGNSPLKVRVRYRTVDLEFA